MEFLLNNKPLCTVIGLLILFIFVYLFTKFLDWFFVNDFINPNKAKKKDENKNKKEIDSNELTQYLFSFAGEGKNLYETVLDLVDSFIDSALSNYFKLEAPEDDHYINREEVAEINKYLLASVSKNMTPDVIHIISLVYNIKTDEELTKFLKLRIKLRMIDVIVNVNKPIE